MRSLIVVASLAALFAISNSTSGNAASASQRANASYASSNASQTSRARGARAGELHSPGMRQAVVLADGRQQEARLLTGRLRVRSGAAALLRNARGKPPPQNRGDEALARVGEGQSARLQHVAREKESGQRKAVGDVVERRRDRCPTGTPAGGTAGPARARRRCATPRGRTSATHSPDHPRRRSRRSLRDRGQSPARPASAIRNAPSPAPPSSDRRDARASRRDDRAPPDADRAPATAGTAPPRCVTP